MQMSLWLLTLGSTLAWASFDVIRKRLVERVAVLPLAAWLGIAQVPGYLLWASVFGGALPGPGYLWPAAASLGLNLLSNVFFLSGMKLIPLSTGIPLLSFTPVFVAVASVPLLGERLGAAQWLGIALVTGGAVTLTIPEGKRPVSRWFGALLGNRGALYLLIVAGLWALTPLFDKVALRHATVGVHGCVLSLGSAFGTALYVIARGRSSDLWISPRQLPGIAAGGLVNVLALGLQMVAISGMIVSVFEAFKRAAGLLLAMALGSLFFREHVTFRKVTAGGVMAAGVLLIVL